MSFGKPIEILLVEDSPDDLELSLRMLRRHGLVGRVRVARDGEAALGMARRGASASDLGLVLLDSRLPKLDSLDVLRQLKTAPSTRGIPVVMMVSSEQERDFLERQGARTDGYVVKPVAFENLTDAVHALGMCCSVCSGRGKDAPRTMAPAGT